MGKPRALAAARRAVAELELELEARELTRSQLAQLLADTEELQLKLSLLRHDLFQRRAALAPVPPVNLGT